MEQYINEGKAFRNLLRKLCFMAFGISAFSNPTDRLNLYNISFGIVIGLLFGAVFKKFLRALMGAFNRSFKKEKGKEAINYAVDTGMLFLVPFAVMALISTFYLKWSMTGGFISAGIMAVGTAVALEIAKLKGRQETKNTIAMSVVAWMFSFVWMLSVQLLVKMPAFLEGGVNLIRSFATKGGASL